MTSQKGSEVMKSEGIIHKKQNEATKKIQKNPATTTINWSSLYKKEDWWAVWIGLTIFALSLPSFILVYIFWDGFP